MKTTPFTKSSKFFDQTAKEALFALWDDFQVSEQERAQRANMYRKRFNLSMDPATWLDKEWRVLWFDEKARLLVPDPFTDGEGDKPIPDEEVRAGVEAAHGELFLEESQDGPVEVER